MKLLTLTCSNRYCLLTLLISSQFSYRLAWFKELPKIQAAFNLTDTVSQSQSVVTSNINKHLIINTTVKSLVDCINIFISQFVNTSLCCSPFLIYLIFRFFLAPYLHNDWPYFWASLCFVQFLLKLSFISPFKPWNFKAFTFQL